MPRYDLGLSYNDSLFSTEEQRQNQSNGEVVLIPIDDIQNFKNHPFKVREDQSMTKLIDSINDNGLMIPIIVRPHPDGNGYEMISGHRRKFALKQLGKTEIKAIVMNLDDDQATLVMVDSNFHREYMSPMEKAYAYKMRYEAMKRQGKRNDLTSSQLGTKLEYNKGRSMNNLAEAVKESRNQIHRYIRLTELIEPFQKMVDGVYESGMTISLNPAYEMSFIKKEHQEVLLDAMEKVQATPSVEQAKHLKQISKLGVFNLADVVELLQKEKANQKEKIRISKKDIDRYFPENFSEEQKIEAIINLLQNSQEKIQIPKKDIDKYFPENYSEGQKADAIVKIISKWAKSRTKNKEER